MKRRRRVSSPLDPEPAQNARRGVGKPRKLFAVDDLAPRHGALKLFALHDYRCGLSHKRPLRFRQAGRAAEVVDQRKAQVR